MSSYFPFCLAVFICAFGKAIADSSSKVVCYLPDWYGDREKPWKFGYSEVKKYIDPNLCTHIHLAFATISNDGTTINLGDGDDNFYTALKSLRDQNSGPKILISLGGWSDSKSNSKIYSKMVADSDKRTTFIKNVKAIVKKNHLDGLDIDWEYPNCWGGDCQNSNDKVNFAKFIKELSDSFHRSNFLVSAAVSPDKDTIENGYEVKSLSKSLDYINVMCYDYAGSDKTGLNAPLDKSKTSMQNWVSAGASPSKLVMGVPLYGKSYTLKDSSKHDIGARTKGNAKGPFVDDENTPYFQICLNVKNNGWTKKSSNQGPYAYKGNQWVGYDDPYSVAAKAKYVKDQGYGGIVVWELGTDDYRGDCCQVKFPLMNTINKALGRSGQDASDCS